MRILAPGAGGSLKEESTDEAQHRCSKVVARGSG